MPANTEPNRGRAGYSIAGTIVKGVDTEGEVLGALASAAVGCAGSATELGASPSWSAKADASREAGRSSGPKSFVNACRISTLGSERARGSSMTETEALTLGNNIHVIHGS